MENIKMRIVGTVLHLEIDMTEDFGLSQSQRSTIIASTRGSIQLYDPTNQDLFEPAILNCTVSRPYRGD